MNADRIILSFPFSGALYYFFDKTLRNGFYSSWGKGYYATLFGKEPNDWLTLALTFTIMYPKVILVPHDHPLPRKIAGEIGETYRDPDLGLIVDWDDYSQIRDSIGEQVQKDLEDEYLLQILANVPPASRTQILFEIRYEITLAQKYGARILCSGGRQHMIKHILAIDTSRYKPQLEKNHQIEFVNQHLEITGVLLNPITLDTLYNLKDDSELQKYATSFRILLNSLPNMAIRDVENKLRELAQSAMESSQTARHAEGTFRNFADIYSLGSLFASGIPIAGTFFSAMDIIYDRAATIAENNRYAHEWYELAPQMTKVITRSKLVQK